MRVSFVSHKLMMMQIKGETFAKVNLEPLVFLKLMSIVAI